jgi:DNA polymerase III alpha subunit
MLLDRASSDKQAREKGQFSLFEAVDTDIEYPNIPEYPLRQKLKYECDTLGVYISAHPLDEFRTELAAYAFNTSMIEGGDSGVSDGAAETDNAFHDMRVCCGGILTECRRIMSKRFNKEFGVARLEDLYGAIDIMLMGTRFDQFKTLLQVDNIVEIGGYLLQRHNETPAIRVDTMRLMEKENAAAPPSAAPATRGNADKRGGGGNARAAAAGDMFSAPPPVSKVCLCYAFGERGEETLSEIQDILAYHPGPDRVYLKNKEDGKIYPLDITVKLAPPLLNELYALIDPDDILIK